MRVNGCYSLPLDRFFAQESWPIVRLVTVVGSLRSGQGPGQGQGTELGMAQGSTRFVNLSKEGLISLDAHLMRVGRLAKWHYAPGRRPSRLLPARRTQPYRRLV